jgi:Pin2-interacting protein X1
MAYTNVCGKKLRAKLGGTLNESAASHSPALLPSSQSFAKRQLEKMGWKEGTGLGKRRDGMQRHVVIKQREGEMGLGREKEEAREIGNAWWKDSVGGTLARLHRHGKETEKKEKGEDGDDGRKRRKGEKKREKKSKSSESDGGRSSSISASSIRTYTDEELFEATGGARFGMRAQRRAEGKWKRTESGSDLAEMERKARSNMEWNGRGSARAIVRGGGASNVATAMSAAGEKRKRGSEDAEDATAAISPSMSDEERDASAGGADAKDERRRSKKEEKRKKRKLERESTEMHHGASLSSISFEEGRESLKEERRKEKEKKEKKEKKKSKKSSKKQRE